MTSLTQRQNAAKTQLSAAFGSLRGFPVRTGANGWGWMHVPRDGSWPAEPSRLPSDAQLREAAKAASALPKAFPRVWKDIVGDAAAWESRASAAIAALRAAHASNAPIPAMPPGTPRGARSAEPSPFACALAWTYCFTPLAAKDLAKLAPCVDEIVAVAGPALASPDALAQAIRWLELLSEHSPASTAAWRAALLRPSSWVPMGESLPIGVSFLRLHQELAAARPTQRTVAMRLLATNAGAELHGEIIRTAVEMLVDAGSAELADIAQILDRLNALAPSQHAAARQLSSWCTACLPSKEWLRALAHFLARPSRAAAQVAHWPKVFDHLHWAWQRTSMKAPAPAHLFAALDALAVVDPSSIGRDPAQLPAALGVACDLAPDARTAALVARALRAADPDRRIPDTLLRSLWEISGSDPSRFGAIAAKVAKLVDPEDDDEPRAPDGLEALGATTVPWLGDLVLAGHAADVLRLLEAVFDASQCRIDLHEVTSAADADLALSAPSLPHGCSETVRLAVEDLMRHEPGALQAAADEVARALPSHAELAKELAAIDSLIAQDGASAPLPLLRRRDALRARLAAPQSFAPSKEERILARVAKRAQRLRLAAWTAAIHRVLLAAIDGAVGMAVPNEWLADPLTARCLRGISEVEIEHQRLAGRVLAAHAQCAWRGHLDDPANARWLERARTAGIDTERWLRGSKPTIVEHPALGRLVIDLERDPLEILKIGAWFKTCLSPHALNFYSTIVVAADANKCVLVARNARSDAVARRIVALDRDMRLYAFRLYTHHTDAAISQAFDGHIERLARSCGAAMPGLSEVEPLTARTWYDDDSYRAHDTFERLLEGHKTHEAVLDALRRECGDELMRRNAIEWISHFACWNNDADASRSAVEHEKLRGVYAALLGEADLSELTDDNIDDILLALEHPLHRETRARVLAACRGLELSRPELALAYVQAGDASEALRVLRRVRGWLAERAVALEALAEVQLSLRRPRKAAETYARALGGCLTKDERARFKARKGEIEGKIEIRRVARVKPRKTG